MPLFVSSLTPSSARIAALFFGVLAMGIEIARAQAPVVSPEPPAAQEAEAPPQPSVGPSEEAPALPATTPIAEAPPPSTEEATNLAEVAPVAPASTSTPAETESPPAPWRGSEFVYTNAVGLIGLQKNSQLTHNPYYAMGFSFRPKWWFGEVFNLGARLDVTRELTEADDTTFDNEAVLDDLRLTAGLSHFYTIPVAEIALSADLRLVFPTSKVSQGRTLIVSVAPMFGVERALEFGSAGALTLGYSVRFATNAHRYTTAELDTALIPGCASPNASCDAFLNTGVRNSRFRFTQAFDITYDPLDWLSISTGLQLIGDYLYPSDSNDPSVSHQTLANTDARYRTLFSFEIATTPMPALGVALGIETLSPRLGLDSTPENPFANRYTNLYLDLSLKVDGLIEQIEQQRTR